MRQLSWRMAPEPPEPYVTFVAHHRPTLTVEAARLVGNDGPAEDLYQEALEDVAARWNWLELQASLGGHDARESYLRRSLSEHAKRWRDQQLYPVEVQAVVPHEPTAYERLRPPPSDTLEFGPVAGAGYPIGLPAGPVPVRPRRAAWVSVALRQAEHVGDTVRADTRPMAEAAIAWWHAYERRRRLGRAGIVIGVLMFLILLLRVGEHYSGG